MAILAMRSDTLTAVGLFSLATVIAAIAANEIATSTFSNPGALSMIATSIVLLASGGTYVGKR
jgi:hypothetical protein